MIILDTTTRSLEVLLDAAPATNQLPIVVSYAELTTTTYTPKTDHTVTSGTTAVTIVAAPAASKQRQIKFISIRNKDTATRIVILQYDDAATEREIVKVSLAVDDMLIYTDGEGFRVLDSSGSVKQASSGQHSALSGLTVGDDHTQYRLESADHSHQTTGLQAGTIDHGLALIGLADDDHPQYLKEEASGGVASEVPDHTHVSGAQAGTLDHGLALTGLLDDDHTQYVQESLHASESFDAGHHARSHDHSVAGDGTTLTPATLNIPSAAAPAQTAEGSAVWDSDDDILTVGDGVSRKQLPKLGTAVASTQAFGDAAVAGTNLEGSRVDHKHAMPADPVIAHAAAADPHTGYVLESLIDAKGDLIAGSAADTVVRLAVGTNAQVLTADSAEASGMKWAAGGGSSTVAQGTVRKTTDFVTTSTSFVDITDLSIVMTTAARRVLLTFSGSAAIDSAAAQIKVTFTVDGTNAGGTNGLQIMEAPTAGDPFSLAIMFLTDVLTAASHTFKVQALTTSGTATLRGNPTMVFNAIEILAAT